MAMRSGLVLSTAMAVAAGLIGTFALMRRMTLTADALSHVALPGIGIALIMGIHPLLGALAALAAGAILVWVLESRTRMATETIVGVVFSAALALGALLTTGEELIDALFGAPGTLSRWELAGGLAGAAAVIVFVMRARDRLVVALVSRDLARTAGVDVPRLNLVYLLAFALTVGLGVRHLGVLLMGSLVIIPAATARRVARDLRQMLAVSVGVAVVSTLLGTWLAERFGRASGPVIVSVAALGFFAASAGSWRAPGRRQREAGR